MYTLELNRREMEYLRAALCDKNLKTTVKMVKCKRLKDVDGEEFQSEQREMGHELLAYIDSFFREEE